MKQIEVVESVVLNAYYPTRWWSSWHNIKYASFRIFNNYDCLVRMEFLGEVMRDGHLDTGEGHSEG